MELLTRKLSFGRKQKRKFFFVPYLVIIILFQFLNVYSSEISLKQNLFLQAKKCLEKPKHKNCKLVIISLETMQLNEASLENYSCQTRLLALQSYLIMSMKRLNKVQPKQKIIDETEEFCL